MLTFGLAVAACDSPPPAAAPRPSAVDPSDGRTVRRLVLLAPPEVRIELLAELEIPVLAASTRADGWRRLTIVSTAKLAAGLADHGFELQPDVTLAAPGEGLESTAEALLAGCASDLDPREVAAREAYFPRYEALSGELLRMDDAAAGISARKVGSSLERRPIVAVRFGPTAKVAGPVPTSYLFATHHANEWGSTMTALELARHLREVSTRGAADPALAEVLKSRAVVIVPVVNPDGYEYSRTVYRDQRSNRRPTGCADPDDDGVDLNRNYPVDWGTVGDSGTRTPCTGVHIGASAASEPETQTVLRLLTDGALFEGPRSTPIAAISYHTFGNLTLYPVGLKAQSDAHGPACDMNSNCSSADFLVHRNVFGDTESPILHEPGLGMPFLSGPVGNVIYTSPGDFLMFADRKAGVLAATVELAFPLSAAHYVECMPDYRARIRANVEQQRTLVLRLLGEAAGLEATSRAESYAARELGVLASGQWTRERSDRPEAQAACPAPASDPLSVMPADRLEWTAHEGCLDAYARPRFTKPSFRRDGGAAPPSARVNGRELALSPLRPGNHYDLFGFDADGLGDPLCLPCAIETFTDGAKSTDLAPSCRGGCVDLADPDRLPGRKRAWSLETEPRGGRADAVWVPVEVGERADDDLVLGDGAAPGGATHCHLTFSTRTTSTYGGRVELLRDGEVVHTWPEPQPVFDLRGAVRMRSYAVEASAGLPARVPELRFRVTRAPTGAGSFELFDPVVYCRVGSLP